MALLPSTASALFTERFTTTEPLMPGSVVSLSGTATKQVRAASSANVSSLYGVVTQVGNGTAEVATAELVQTLVSTAHGDIVVGSPITASELKGVGQKATTAIRIVGFAQASFNAKSPQAKVETFKDRAGTSQTMSVGAVPVMLGALNYVASAGTTAGDNGDGSWLPSQIQTFFASIAGHQVVPSRIVLSLFLLLVAVVVIGMLIGTAVHGSVVSIGRNPLASRSLLRALLQVVVVAIVLMAGAMGGVYLIVSH
jgi:hypothetical protein